MGEGELVRSLCICISGFTHKYLRLLVAVKNGPLHMHHMSSTLVRALTQSGESNETFPIFVQAEPRPNLSPVYIFLLIDDSIFH